MIRVFTSRAIRQKCLLRSPFRARNETLAKRSFDCVFVRIVALSVLDDLSLDSAWNWAGGRSCLMRFLWNHYAVVFQLRSDESLRWKGEKYQSWSAEEPIRRHYMSFARPLGTGTRTSSRALANPPLPIIPAQSQREQVLKTRHHYH